MQPFESVINDPFLSGIAASLIAAVIYESVIRRMNYKVLISILSFLIEITYKASLFTINSLNSFARKQWVKLKPTLRRIKKRHIGYSLLSIVLLGCGAYGYLSVRDFAVRNAMLAHSRTAELEAAKQQYIAKMEVERLAKAEQTRIEDEKWKKFALEHSSNAAEYKFIYNSHSWIPFVIFFVAIYVIGNSGYLFIAMGKTAAVCVFVLSLTLLSPRFFPDLASWNSVTQLNFQFDKLCETFSLLNDPAVWLVASVLAGLLLEVLARGTRK